MNYYAEAIELCSTEQDWKKIAINIAKKHPKMFVEAADSINWKTKARELYLEQDKFVEAIKYCRQMTGMGVKDAKEAVESLK